MGTEKKSTVRYGFHFLSYTGRLGYGDRRIVKTGPWVKCISLPPKLCFRGMHAAPFLSDALMFHNGRNVLCLVAVRGNMDYSRLPDSKCLSSQYLSSQYNTYPLKFCGVERRIVWKLSVYKTELFIGEVYESINHECFDELYKTNVRNRVQKVALKILESWGKKVYGIPKLYSEYKKQVLKDSDYYKPSSLR